MTADNSPVPILYIDETLLVIDKPAGLPTLPDGYDPAAAHVRGLMEPYFGTLWIVHRLDRGTSGVLLLARSAEAHRALNTQFDQRQVKKVYHALATGSPAWKVKTVDLPLRIDVGHKHRTAVDPARGKPAVTHLRVMERFAGYSLVEATPETGRTHQIRAHLAAVGHPLLGDELYGSYLEAEAVVPEAGWIAYPAPTQKLMPRLGLHARRLTFTHPILLSTLHCEAPYPEDFAGALDRLRGKQVNR